METILLSIVKIIKLVGKVLSIFNINKSKYININLFSK